MDPKAKSTLRTIAGEKSAAKHSNSNPVKSSKSSQKKAAPVENINESLSSISAGELYFSDDKEKRSPSSCSGAKVGRETKSGPSLVSRVTDYLEDDADVAAAAAAAAADGQSQSSTTKKGKF